VEGRLLAASDPAGAIVVNETMAREIDPGGHAVGRTLLLRDAFFDPDGAPPAFDSVFVVGIVPDAVRDPINPLEPVPFVYRPLLRTPQAIHLVARPDDAASGVAWIQEAISGIDPAVPWMRIEPATAALHERIDPSRSLAMAVNSLASIALWLSTAGLFAVLSYNVSLRTREIGVRMALGARAGDVRRLVTRQAVRLTLAGLAAGLALALPLAHAMRVVFLGISPFDPVALAPAMAILAASAVAAAWLPARRAAAVDPARTLRAD
jgi:hypothetical protein